jgi:glycosyltransferase involved in cell wall biosynthesis
LRRAVDALILVSVIAILHVAQPTDAGVARYVADLTVAQVAVGERVAVVCPSHGPLAGWARRAHASHLDWAARRAPGPGLVGEIRTLAAHVRAWEPDIVHLHSSKAGLAGRLAIRGRIATVFQPHAWSFEAVTGLAGWLAQRWERSGAQWSDRIVCVSEAEAQRGRARRIRAPIHVIPNGVDVDAWPPTSPAESAAARRRFDMGTKPVAVSVGRLSRQKGQDVLLDAWPIVRANVPGATLFLVGDGPDRAALERKAGPGVIFAGTADSVRPWLAAADLVVVASRWEGMSLAMLEAMACARCVVSTVVSGAGEALPAAAIVPRENPSALAASIVDRLSDSALREREATAARRNVETRFDFARAADAIARLYENILSARDQ